MLCCGAAENTTSITIWISQSDNAFCLFEAADGSASMAGFPEDIGGHSATLSLVPTGLQQAGQTVFCWPKVTEISLAEHVRSAR